MRINSLMNHFLGRGALEYENDEYVRLENKNGAFGVGFHRKKGSFVVRSKKS